MTYYSDTLGNRTTYNTYTDNVPYPRQYSEPITTYTRATNEPYNAPYIPRSTSEQNTTTTTYTEPYVRATNEPYNLPYSPRPVSEPITNTEPLTRATNAPYNLPYNPRPPIAETRYEPVYIQQVPVEPVRYQPVQVEPVRYQPVQVEPVRYQPVQVEPVRYQPVQVEPVRYQPVQVEPVRYEPVQVEPVRYEQVRIEPVQVEPVRYEQVRIEPVQVEPVRYEPVQVQPVLLEPVRVEPTYTEPTFTLIREYNDYISRPYNDYQEPLYLNRQYLESVSPSVIEPPKLVRQPSIRQTVYEVYTPPPRAVELPYVYQRTPAVALPYTPVVPGPVEPPYKFRAVEVPTITVTPPPVERKVELLTPEPIVVVQPKVTKTVQIVDPPPITVTREIVQPVVIPEIVKPQVVQPVVTREIVQPAVTIPPPIQYVWEEKPPEVVQKDIKTTTIVKEYREEPKIIAAPVIRENVVTNYELQRQYLPRSPPRVNIIDPPPTPKIPIYRDVPSLKYVPLVPPLRRRNDSPSRGYIPPTRRMVPPPMPPPLILPPPPPIPRIDPLPAPTLLIPPPPSPPKTFREPLNLPPTPHILPPPPPRRSEAQTVTAYAIQKARTFPPASKTVYISEAPSVSRTVYASEVVPVKRRSNFRFVEERSELPPPPPPPPLLRMPPPPPPSRYQEVQINVQATPRPAPTIVETVQKETVRTTTRKNSNQSSHQNVNNINMRGGGISHDDYIFERLVINNDNGSRVTRSNNDNALVNGSHLSLYPPTRLHGEEEPVRVHPPTKFRSDNVTTTSTLKDSSSRDNWFRDSTYPNESTSFGGENDVIKYYSPDLSQTTRRLGQDVGDDRSRMNDVEIWEEADEDNDGSFSFVRQSQIGSQRLFQRRKPAQKTVEGQPNLSDDRGVYYSRLAYQQDRRKGGKATPSIGVKRSASDVGSISSRQSKLTTNV